MGVDIVLKSIALPVAGNNSVYEFTGSSSLREIGLAEKFYFQAPDKFAVMLSSFGFHTSLKPTQQPHQRALAAYLCRSIELGRLVEPSAMAIK
ncbi:hypothetical protein DXN05_23680 [Deminuibacter soli]|uniref:Uncharacterized protein n=2 Tax=Deminuibacter soli TaxID=2291815 RepID=A0A3E1ND21_9BACT|nr:hypothetical protein DXN05_23680 [Deminuibacter soli]